MRRYTGPDEKTRLKVVGRAGMRCERCGKGADYWLGADIHHRKPRRMGGTSDPEINSPSNLVLLCRGCHSEVESRRAQALADGWLVYASGDPSRVPVNLPGFGPTLLTKDGKYDVTEDERG
jgi:5-methylcytosine-specific restriction protein A